MGHPDLESLPLAALIERIRRGDRDGFVEVVRRFERTAQAAAFAMTRDLHLAQDVVQEAFAEAFLELDRLRDPAAFPGWFRRIVFKQADRLLRRPRAPLAGLDAAADLADRSPDPERSAELRRAGDRLRAALDRLPDHERIVATLFYLADRGHREIADFLVLPVSTIKKRLHDGRRRLRNELGDTLPEWLAAIAPGPAPVDLALHVQRVSRASSASRRTRPIPPPKEVPMTIHKMTVLLNVSDVEKAIGFYCDALGFSCTNQWKNQGRIRWARVENGAANIMLNEHGEQTEHRLERDSYRDTVLYLAVDNADAVYEKLQSDGYTTSELFDADYGLREFHLRDLEGYDLAITSPLPR